MQCSKEQECLTNLILNDMESKGKLKALCESYYSIKADYKRELISTICKELQEIGGEMNFKNFTDEDYERIQAHVCLYVLFDGGNHPEYGLNEMEIVNIKRINEMEFAIDFNEESDYPMDRLRFGDIENVYDIIEECKKYFID